MLVQLHSLPRILSVWCDSKSMHLKKKSHALLMKWPPSQSPLYSALYFTVARSAEGRPPSRPHGFSVVSVPGAFLRPAGGRCRVENLNSSVYVYHANLQSENCETPVSCDNLPRDFLGLRSNVCPISSRFSSVSTWRVLWSYLSRTEPVSRNLFTNCIPVRRTDIGESVSK